MAPENSILTLRDRVLTFWFGEIGGPRTLVELKERTKFWFFRSETTDAEIRDRFGRDVERAARAELAELEATARGCLALVLLLDQFPRNLYRQSARAFAADSHALGIVLRSLDRGTDGELTAPERMMFYMPLMHSEELAIQKRSVDLFRRLHAESPPELAEELAGALKFAERHREIVERFGRYPHRNAALGRISTERELAFLSEPNSSF